MTTFLQAGDFIKEITTTTNTGDIHLPNVAVDGYVTWDSWYGDGPVPYVLNDQSGVWEVGIGTYDSATHTISRDYIEYSSDGGTAVDLTGKAAYVYPGPSSTGAALTTQKHNMLSVAIPTVTDDITKGYATGSFWFLYGSGGILFFCIHAAAGAAQWVRLHGTQFVNNGTMVGDWLGGSGNTMTAAGVGLGGSHNSLAATDALVSGHYASAIIAGCRVDGAAELTSPVAGQHQRIEATLALRTTNATPAAMLQYANGAGSTYLTVPPSTAWWVTVDVVGWNSSGNLASSWHIQSLVKRNGSGTPTIVGSTSATAIEQDGGAAAWAVAVAIDSTHNAVEIDVTGAAATTISWTASLKIQQAS